MTLKEIEEHLQPSMADELSKKEKAFRELLSDIKYKSEIMRKKKRN
jgi:hypothetical protein